MRPSLSLDVPPRPSDRQWLRCWLRRRDPSALCRVPAQVAGGGCQRAGERRHGVDDLAEVFASSATPVRKNASHSRSSPRSRTAWRPVVVLTAVLLEVGTEVQQRLRKQLLFDHRNATSRRLSRPLPSRNGWIVSNWKGRKAPRAPDGVGRAAQHGVQRYGGDPGRGAGGGDRHGQDTEVGRIAGLAQTTPTDPTPLQVEIGRMLSIAVIHTGGPPDDRRAERERPWRLTARDTSGVGDRSGGLQRPQRPVRDRLGVPRAVRQPVGCGVPSGSRRCCRWRCPRRVAEPGVHRGPARCSAVARRYDARQCPPPRSASTSHAGG